MTRSTIAFVALAMVLGCVSVRPIESGEVPVLGSHEGILVVHLDSTLPIKKLALSHATVVSNLPEGEHFYLIVVGAGWHRWGQIVIPAGEGDVPFRMARHEVTRLHVEAGRINYPGQIIVGGKTRAKTVEISVHAENRSALALRMLRERYPEVLARYPPVYGGPKRDDFLEYYWRTFLTPDDSAAKALSR